MDSADALDREIIRQLQADGRRSNVDIAREVGVAEATVRKRLEHMLSEGALRICALPNPAAVGLPVQAIIALELEVPLVASAIARLRAMSAVRSIYRVTGESDVMVDAVFASDEDLSRFVTDGLRDLPGLRHTKSALVLEVVQSFADWRLPAPRPRILVVDDDPDYVEVTRSALEREGFEVVTAENGRDALAWVREAPPDLVIMDVMMESTLDGLATSRELREDRRFRDVPVVMVTSITESEYGELFPTDEALPVDAFLTKPVSTKKLIGEVRRALRRR